MGRSFCESVKRTIGMYQEMLLMVFHVEMVIVMIIAIETVVYRPGLWTYLTTVEMQNQGSWSKTCVASQGKSDTGGTDVTNAADADAMTELALYCAELVAKVQYYERLVASLAVPSSISSTTSASSVSSMVSCHDSGQSLASSSLAPLAGSDVAAVADESETEQTELTDETEELQESNVRNRTLHVK